MVTARATDNIRSTGAVDVGEGMVQDEEVITNIVGSDEYFARVWFALLRRGMADFGMQSQERFFHVSQFLAQSER